jgi:hypothetical protein
MALLYPCEFNMMPSRSEVFPHPAVVMHYDTERRYLQTTIHPHSEQTLLSAPTVQKAAARADILPASLPEDSAHKAGKQTSANPSSNTGEVGHD